MPFAPEPHKRDIQKGPVLLYGIAMSLFQNSHTKETFKRGLYSSNTAYYCMEAHFLFCKTATHKETFKRRHSKEPCIPGIEPIVVRYRKIPFAKEPHKRDIQKSPIFLEYSLSLYGSARSLLQNSLTQRKIQESPAYLE